MKRNIIIAVLLAALLLMGLTACKSKPEATAEPTAEPTPEQTQKPAETQPTEAPEPEDKGETTAEPTSKPAPEEEQTMEITVYYLKDDGSEMYLVKEVHTVEKTEAVARAALKELISGTPLTEGAVKVLPADTEILGINIKDGLATVDFSREVLNANVGSSGESLGILSIVNTLTEFPTIEKVQFTVEGSAENAMDWWGHVGLYDQPFKRDVSMVR
ncbi:MAG: GerMN domain-containing protein [Oscillospiraceae bacterium]|jgi:germination protein M